MPSIRLHTAIHSPALEPHPHVFVHIDEVISQLFPPGYIHRMSILFDIYILNRDIYALQVAGLLLAAQLIHSFHNYHAPFDLSLSKKGGF